MKMHSTKCVIPYPYKVSKCFFLTHLRHSPPPNIFALVLWKTAHADNSHPLFLACVRILR